METAAQQPSLPLPGTVGPSGDAADVAQSRAEHRRSNLQAVWGEQGRAVLAALDSLPEDVLLDADTTPPSSPTYLTAPPTQSQQQTDAQQQEQFKGQSKGEASPRQ